MKIVDVNPEIVRSVSSKPRIQPAKPCVWAGTQTCIGGGEFGGWKECENAEVTAPDRCGIGNDDLDCNPTGEGCEKANVCEDFSFGTGSRPVDIIWIIDQSESMEEEQAAIQANMNAFVSFIGGQNIDYRVIVVAARWQIGYFPFCMPQPLAGPNCSDSDRYRQIDRGVYSNDSLQIFAEEFSSIEKHLRPGSMRHIVEVSDDESLDMSADQFDSVPSCSKGFRRLSVPQHRRDAD